MRSWFRHIAAISAAFLLAGSVQAQSITVPETIKVDTPGLIVIRATNLDADDCRWFVIGGGIQTFPPDVVAPKAGVFLGLAMKEGTYKLGVIVAKAVNGKAVLSLPTGVTVIVGSGGPIPPDPPPGPTPVDPFLKDLNAAWLLDTDTDKVASARALAASFRIGATSTAGDGSLRTIADFWNSWKKTVTIASTAIPKTRQAIGGSLSTFLPTDMNAALDDNTRRLIVTNFTRIATDLEALK